MERTVNFESEYDEHIRLETGAGDTYVDVDGANGSTYMDVSSAKGAQSEVLHSPMAHQIEQSWKDNRVGLITNGTYDLPTHTAELPTHTEPTYPDDPGGSPLQTQDSLTDHTYATVSDATYAEVGAPSSYITVFPAQGTNFKDIIPPKGDATLGLSQVIKANDYSLEDTIESLRQTFLGFNFRVRPNPFKTPLALKEVEAKRRSIVPSISTPLQTLVDIHQEGIAKVDQCNQKIKTLDDVIQSCPEMVSKSILETMNKFHESEKSSVETYQERFFESLKTIIPNIRRISSLAKQDVDVQILEGEQLKVTLSQSLIEFIKAKIKTDSDQQSAKWIREKKTVTR